MKLKIALLSLSLLASATVNSATLSVSTENFEESLNSAVALAQSGDTIQMPAGKFMMKNEFLITKSGLTIRGEGAAKTILSFKNQKAGPQGILATKDDLTLMNFAVEDTAGNGIKVIGAKGLVMDGLRVTWTAGPKQQNGSYGLYPVLMQNVLIQNCDVSGASDAGIYVGQSKQIIVRRNYIHQNVAGLEIENSSDADVTENLAKGNTVGILVFDLPDLLVKEGSRTRVFNNLSTNNNLKNFSTKGSIINLMPSGIGMFALAAKNLEIFHNNFLGNKLSGVGIANYYISGRKITDTQYNPMPRGVSIYNNVISHGSWQLLDFNQTTLIIKVIFGLQSPSILYDGIDDGTYNGQKPNEEDRICINGNVDEKGAASSFGNLHLDHQRKGYPFPGGPGTHDIETHNCTHPRLPKIMLAALNPQPGSEQRPSEDEINRVCKTTGADVNLAAIDYDCPDLADYRLFKNPSDATKSPNGNGLAFTPNNELFTDYAVKNRFVFLPSGMQMEFKNSGPFDFPVGTVIAKTFSVYRWSGNAKQLAQVETRLLIHRRDGWTPLNYVWDAQTKRAALKYGGTVQDMTISPDDQNKKINISYHIPNLQQCASCHNVNDQIQPIGLKAKFLNWNENQGENLLQKWQRIGVLKNLPGDPTQVQKIPSWWDASGGSLEERAKGYLDINCSHCHNDKGNARNTGLYLNWETDAKSKQYGVCKTPVAAGIGSGGKSFAIQPGSADDSVLYYRLTQSHLAVKMPQLGRSTVHTEAVNLIKSWINAQQKVDCKIGNK